MRGWVNDGAAERLTVQLQERISFKMLGANEKENYVLSKCQEFIRNIIQRFKVKFPKKSEVEFFIKQGLK